MFGLYRLAEANPGYDSGCRGIGLQYDRLAVQNDVRLPAVGNHDIAVVDEDVVHIVARNPFRLGQSCSVIVGWQCVGQDNVGRRRGVEMSNIGTTTSATLLVPPMRASSAVCCCSDDVIAATFSALLLAWP